MSDISDLFEINKRLTLDLWHLKDENGKPHELSPRLIFPKKRINEDDIRICEQEAKVLYCNVLNNLNYFYSIETPTRETYQQEGKTPRCANSDLSIFKHSVENGQKGFKKAVNVEFKANKPEQENFRKDIEKLIREKQLGNWIHIIDGLIYHRKGYIEKIFDFIIKSFDQCKNRKYLVLLNKGKKKIEKIEILFYIYSINERWACMKRFYFDNFKYDNEEEKFMEYVKEFFKIEFTFKEKIGSENNEKYKYIEIVNKNDWYILAMKDYHDQIYNR